MQDANSWPEAHLQSMLLAEGCLQEIQCHKDHGVLTDGVFLMTCWEFVENL